jgi:hypothetical protein
MLSPSQYYVLLVTLLQRLPGNPGPAMVAPYVGAELTLEMPVVQSVRDAARWILDQVLAQPQPRLLIRLIRMVDDGDVRMASLVEVAESLDADPARWRSTTPTGEVDWSPLGDPLQVRDGRPFVDRNGFRGLIPRVGSPESPPCTVVLGDSGHGKTYLYEFLKQLADQWGQDTLRVAYSACPSSNPSELDAEMIAFDLAPDLRTDFSKKPRRHEDPHRYARNLVHWICDATPAGPLPSLVILDGFDHRSLGDDVHTFIEGLIESVQTDPDVTARLRVLLLGYDVGRLESRGLELTSSVLEWVDEGAIAQWFRKRYPNEPEYRYNDTAAQIHEMLPEEGSLRMRNLCSLVRMIARQGFEGA